MGDDQQVVDIIDDDPAVRESLSWMLQAAGFEVRAFASAEAFLAGRAPERVGCLVLDLNLPGMNGLELQEKLAADAAPCPVILITARGGSPEIQRAVAEGKVVALLNKPFDGDFLLTLVRTCLARTASARPPVDVVMPTPRKNKKESTGSSKRYP